jgi:hypothetical protein
MARRSPKLAKQTIDDNPLLEEVTQSEINSGMGLRIEEPLEIGRNPNVTYLQSPDAMMEIVPTEVAAMAVYKPSLLACPIKFNDIEKKINSGPEKFADLIQLRLNQARRSMAEILNQALYGRGENLKTIGLGAYVPTTVGSNTVGTISEANAPFWKSQVRTGAASWAQNGHNGTAQDYMLDMWITCSSSMKGGHPDLLVADPLVYQYYSATEGQKIRITSNNPGLGGVYDNSMTYRGVPIVFDKNADAGTVFFLHRKAFKWYVAPGLNMDVSDMRRVSNQPFVSYVVLALFHQWVCTRRQLLGKITGWTR